jgi:hypothetical protein
MKHSSSAKGFPTMMKHIPASLFALTLLAGPLFAEPPKKPSDEKKPLVKPPFPDGDLELPLLPPPLKISPVAEIAPIAEIAPLPRLNDTNKSFDIIMVAATEGAAPTDGRIGVGFFNHSDRDVTLEVNKRTIKLGSRHYLQLKLPRDFDWREKEGPVQTTNVPSDSEGVEIVFRR